MATVWKLIIFCLLIWLVFCSNETLGVTKLGRSLDTGLFAMLIPGFVTQELLTSSDLRGSIEFFWSMSPPFPTTNSAHGQLQAMELLPRQLVQSAFIHWLVCEVFSLFLDHFHGSFSTTFKCKSAGACSLTPTVGTQPIPNFPLVFTFPKYIYINNTSDVTRIQDLMYYYYR